MEVDVSLPVLEAVAVRFPVRLEEVTSLELCVLFAVAARVAARVLLDVLVRLSVLVAL